MIGDAIKSLGRLSLGPAAFGAVLANVFVLQWSMWDLYIGTFRRAEFYLPFFLVNLVVSVALTVSPGTFGQLGRGMLIAWLSVPASLIIFISGFAIANAIGPI